jgi:hypothetical protein
MKYFTKMTRKMMLFFEKIQKIQKIQKIYNYTPFTPLHF